MSNDKEKVRSFRQHHRIDPSNKYVTYPKYCLMKKTKMGTWVRPSILRGMNSRLA